MPKKSPTFVVELRTMSAIPRECVWGLKIMYNWQKTISGKWSETTELVTAAFERKGGEWA